MVARRIGVSGSSDDRDSHISCHELDDTWNDWVTRRETGPVIV